MYDVGVALRRFRGLIRWSARKYSIKGNFRLAVEDIEAEGLLTLVQCCRAFPEGQTRFARYFKRSWNNRLKKLLRYGVQKKRQGVEVELELAEGVVSECWPQDFAEKVKDRAKELSPLLSREAKRFLQLLIEPSEEVMEFAWRDFCRKNKLRSQGVRVPGWRIFRIKLRHIRGVLQMSRRQIRRVTKEIRAVNQQLVRWRHDEEGGVRQQEEAPQEGQEIIPGRRGRGRRQRPG